MQLVGVIPMMVFDTLVISGTPETHDGLSEIVPSINIHFDKANAKEEYRTGHKHSAVVLTPKDHIPKAR